MTALRWSPRQRRLAVVLGLLLLLGLAVLLMTRVLRSNLVFFVTPTQILQGEARGRDLLRVGGLVQPGSIRRDQDRLQFVLMDGGHTVPVRYRGILPDLFAEGKGAIAQGRLLPDGSLAAVEVLAKHDENYMPPEVQKALGPGHGPQGGRP